MDAKKVAQSLGAKVEEAPSVEITLTLTTFGGVKEIKAIQGQTVEEVKRANGLTSSKLVTEAGVILQDSDVLREDASLFISASKQNGSEKKNLS